MKRNNTISTRIKKASTTNVSWSKSNISMPKASFNRILKGMTIPKAAKTNK